MTETLGVCLECYAIIPSNMWRRLYIILLNIHVQMPFYRSDVHTYLSLWLVLWLVLSLGLS